MDDEDSEQFQSADEGLDFVQECETRNSSSDIHEFGEKLQRKSSLPQTTEITQSTSADLKLDSKSSPATSGVKALVPGESESKSLPSEGEKKIRSPEDQKSVGKSAFGTVEPVPPPKAETPPLLTSVTSDLIRYPESKSAPLRVDKKVKGKRRKHRSAGESQSDAVESESTRTMETPLLTSVSHAVTTRDRELESPPPRVEKKDRRRRKDRRNVDKSESDTVESEPTPKMETPPLLTSVANDMTTRDRELESPPPGVEKKDRRRRKDHKNVDKSESDTVESEPAPKMETPPLLTSVASDMISKEPLSRVLSTAENENERRLKVDSDVTKFGPVNICRTETPDGFQKERSVVTHDLSESLKVLEALPVSQNQKQKTRSPTQPSVTSDSVSVKSNGKGQHNQQHSDSVQTCSIPASLSYNSARLEQEHLDSVKEEALLNHPIEELAISKQKEDLGTHEAERVSPILNQTNGNRREVPSDLVDLSASTESPRHLTHVIDVDDENVWNPELLSTTATHLVRGVGDGLNILADAFAQVVNLGVTNNEEGPELFDRRRRRALESKAERETLTEAWSNVWNTAWGVNDEWDVEEVNIPEPNVDSHASRTNPVDNGTEEVGPTSPGSRPEPFDSAKSQSSAFWDWSGVSSLAQQLTSSFQTKGLNLVHEGVNVLEKIGKKTMSVIEENDPGFQYTKTLFRPPGLQERPNLSQIIREAHERHQTERSSETPSNETNRGSLTAQLESRRALVHLEALELVSDKAESQLHIQLDAFSNAGVVHEELNLDGGILEAIWKTLQLDMVDDDDDQNENASFPDQSTWKVLKCKKQQPGSYGAHPTDLSEKNSLVWVAFERSLSLIKTIYPGEKLLQSVTNVWNEMKKVEANVSAEEIYFIAIGAFAEVTSAYLEYLHKFSECTLVRAHKPTADFHRLTSIVAIMFRAAMKLVDALCSEYTRTIKSAHKTEGDGKPVKSVSQLAGGLLLECGNAQAYLRNTAHLLVPILQLACVNTKRAAAEME